MLQVADVPVDHPSCSKSVLRRNGSVCSNSISDSFVWSQGHSELRRVRLQRAALAMQHAVIQFRLIETEDDEGNVKRVIRCARTHTRRIRIHTHSLPHARERPNHAHAQHTGTRRWHACTRMQPDTRARSVSTAHAGRT